MNKPIKGYLDYVLEHIHNDNVGICFDAGHCHAHFEDEFNWDLFQDRIFAVHLHDNDGTEDQHLLPFDGTVPWEKDIEKLVSANYEGYITLEIAYHRDYTKMPITEFYEKGYALAEELREMFEKQRDLTKKEYRKTREIKREK